MDGSPESPEAQPRPRGASDTTGAMPWPALSARLDELLDLSPADRTARLQAMAAEGVAEAEALARLLAHHDAAERDAFLDTQLRPLSPLLPETGEVGARRFGAWQVLTLLGEGGMGSVWRARRDDGRFEGEAAIKLMHGRLQGGTALRRFEREGRILGRLTHPNIARLLDAGVADTGQPFLVLELVLGEPIDRWCETRRLPVEARLALFADVAEAVAAAHAQLVVHRDLKPGNVLVEDRGQGVGRVKLLDFGIATLLNAETDGSSDADAEPQGLTRTGQRPYTPGWAAPEQVQGLPVGTAADIWSLGVLLCCLLTGRHPSGLGWGSDAAAWMRAAAEARVQRPSRLVLGHAAAESEAQARGSTPARLARRLEGELDQIVLRALAEEPARRYPTALALAEDVRRHLRHEPITAHADTLGYRAAKFARRNRLVVGAASVSLLTLLAGVLGTAWQAREAAVQRDAARAAQAEALAQAARAEAESAQARRSAAEAERQRSTAEAEARRAEAAGAQALAAQRSAQTSAAEARSARTETERQLQQTLLERAEAKHAARSNAASNDVFVTLLEDMGESGRPLTSVELLQRAERLVANGYSNAPALQAQLYLDLSARYSGLNLVERELDLRALALTAARRSGDVTVIALVLCSSVDEDIKRAATEEAASRIAEARRLLSTLEHEARLGTRHACLNAESQLAVGRGNAAESVRLSQQAVKMIEDAGERDSAAYVYALGNLSYYHLNAGQSAAAFEILLKLSAAMDRNGRSSTSTRMTIFNNLTVSYAAFGEFVAGRETLREALTRQLGPDLSQPGGPTDQSSGYGIMLFQLHQDDEARRWLEYSLAQAREHGALSSVLDSCLHLAQVHLRQQRLAEADATLLPCEATTAANATRFQRHRTHLLRTRAQWHLLRGEAETAYAMLSRIAGDIPSPPGPANDRARVAHLPTVVNGALAVGRLEEAQQMAQTLLASAERVARIPNQSAHVGRALRLLGDVQQRRLASAEARDSWQRALPALRNGLGPTHPQVLETERLLASR